MKIKTIVITLQTITIIGFIIYAKIQSIEIEKQRVLSSELQMEVEKYKFAKLSTEHLKKMADEQRVFAEQQKIIADEQRLIAERYAIEAKKQTEIAVKQTQIAIENENEVMRQKKLNNQLKVRLVKCK